MIKKSTMHFEWLDFARYYLALAALGCKELREHKYQEKTIDGLSPEYSVEQLLVPILFNVKHSIEVFIKALKISLVGRFDIKADGIHDVAKLIAVLEGEFKKKKKGLQKQLTALARKYPNDSGLVNLVNDAQNLDKTLSELKQLVMEFYSCQILKKKIGDDFRIEDLHNDAFRYPENNIKIKLDYGKILPRFSEVEIDDLYQKICKLGYHFLTLGLVFSLYKNPNVQK